MCLFHKVFKGTGYSITPAMTNWVTYCTSVYTKSNLVGVYSVIIMEPTKTQDTITHLYNLYCRKVPNLSGGGRLVEWRFANYDCGYNVVLYIPVG